MKPLKLITLCCLILFSLLLNAQSTDSLIVFRYDENNALQLPNISGENLITSNNGLNALISNNPSIRIGYLYPSTFEAVSPSELIYLQNYFYIKGVFNADSLIEVLENSRLPIFEIKVCGKPITTYNPNDYNGNGTIPIGEWHYLDNLHAKETWDITQGNECVKIAVLDLAFNPLHEDLIDKVDYKDKLFYAGLEPHGTATAQICAGGTNNGKGLSSLGHNCRLEFYDGIEFGDNINKAGNRGIRIINISMVQDNPTIYDANFQKIITANAKRGVFVIASAGNARPSVEINNTNYIYPASYDDVFSVSGVWPDGSHRNQQTDPSFDITYQHNDKVDLCAYSYHIWHAWSGTTGYSWGDGTSFAAPQVSATVALMLSVNPLLTNDQIEYILKTTSDPIYQIADNYKYAGKLGAGLLNPLEAVKLSKTINDLVVDNGSTQRINHDCIYQKITIKNGSTLKISNCSLSMLDNGKITIEPGAKLELVNVNVSYKNPPINNICINSTGSWEGIYVEGDRNKPQTDNHQGVLNMINSTISGSINGISTISKNDNGVLNYKKSGGIINALNCTFEENKVNLYIYSYHNILTIGLNKFEINNRCKFTNCEFRNSNQLKSGNPVLIKLIDVKGITFEACKFNDPYHYPINTQDYPYLATGIYSLNASFTVKGMITQYNSDGTYLIKKSEFIGLQYGIYSANYSTGNSGIIVNHSKFTSCMEGIFGDHIDGSKIYDNDFIINQLEFENPVGIHCVNSNNIIIERNNLTGDNNHYASSSPLGIIFNNTGTNSSNSYILNNYLLGSGRGLQIENDAHSTTITCNSFEDNMYGITMGATNASNIGITYLNMYASLGECGGNLPANYTDYNNKFYRSRPGIHDLVSFTQENQISNKFLTLDHVIYSGANRLYPPVSTSSNSSIRYKLSDCSASDPNKIKLLVCSNKIQPDLDINIEVIDENLFFQKKKQLQNVENEFEGIALNQQIDSLRTEIVNNYQSKLQSDFDEFIYLNYMGFLEKDNEPESKQLLAQLYLNAGDINKLQELMLNLSVENSADSGFFLQMNFGLQLLASDKVINEYENSDSVLLQQFSNIEYANLKNAIFNIHGYPLKRFEIFEVPELYDSIDINPGSVDSLSLDVYPNPVSDNTVSIAYSAPKSNNLSLAVYDKFGTLQQSVDLKNNIGQTELNISELPTGIYSIHLFVNGINSISRKLIVIKI